MLLNRCLIFHFFANVISNFPRFFKFEFQAWHFRMRIYISNFEKVVFHYLYFVYARVVELYIIEWS